MIASFRHKGLKRLFEDDDQNRLPTDMVEKIGLILGALAEAESIEDLNQPTFRLHSLKGDLKGFWSVTVRANWRVRFEADRALDVDLVDYH
jgi:toxin HigB-1